ncbi:hypothetical protein [Aneurinibacillus uraniidurans]|uniref:hypothetical protein n=1 Tax=Aneurinibacillus uraniidurans TaxID=2966586 RepID=UPI0023493E96|nr:hypothetical protein [Aneurinibacillus sp. B1]WCN39532.1 hypothetical protein PO771_09095 [Aneurinibacillus sp. B1]
MKKIVKTTLACLLALTVSAPVALLPAQAEAATKKAAAKKAAYTTAERTYIKYQSDILYKLRTQSSDIVQFALKADQYENKEEEFYTIMVNKLTAWEKTYKQASKYQPKDVPAKLKQAHASYTQAVQQQGIAIQSMKKTLLEDTLTDEQMDTYAEKFFTATDAFGKPAAAFDAEIKRLNKIYQ